MTLTKLKISRYFEVFSQNPQKQPPERFPCINTYMEIECIDFRRDHPRCDAQT